MVRGASTSYFMFASATGSKLRPPADKIFFLSGIIAASLQTLAISAPLYPSVIATSLSKSIPSEILIPLRLMSKRALLPTESGNGI
jgi:hypothetical protein